MSNKLSYYEWIVNDVMPDELFYYQDFDIQGFLESKKSFLASYSLDYDFLESELHLVDAKLLELKDLLTTKDLDSQTYNNIKKEILMLEKRSTLLYELYPYFGSPYSEFLKLTCHLYNINPKIILVTLQKEQSLVTKVSKPPKKIMDKALGFGVTDSGTLNQYLGFEIQNYNAIKDHKLDFDKYLKFNIQPIKTVDNGTLKIQPLNAFTSVLYEYTPWTGSPDSIYYPKWGSHGVYLFWKIWRWWWPDELKLFFHKTKEQLYT